MVTSPLLDMHTMSLDELSALSAETTSAVLKRTTGHLPEMPGPSSEFQSSI